MNAAVATALRDAAARLSETSDTARLDAELLMAHALGVSRSDMLLGKGSGEPNVPEAFEQYVERRAGFEPVAYIIGNEEFYGRTFRVNRDTLIPRGDSETLIEAAISDASSAKRVLDLGTGSGALLITALLELEDASGVATDISADALKVAQSNAEWYGLTREVAQFERRDWRMPGWTAGLGAFDLILCNPPYVEENASLAPNVCDFEPHSALFSGPEGLDDYRILIPQIADLLNTGGTAIFEIGATQGEAVRAIAGKAGFQSSICHDLANRPRAVILHQ